MEVEAKSENQLKKIKGNEKQKTRQEKVETLRRK